MFGGQPAPQRLPWSWAKHQFADARNYWIATTRSDGRPHTRPVWGIWLNNAFYFSTGSLAAGNFARSDEITVHLESGDSAVIIEGTAGELRAKALLRRVVALYNEKYGWDLDADHLPGPMYSVRPRVAFGWVSDPSGRDRGAAFHGTATRWKFE
jgi:hypothetical protein